MTVTAGTPFHVAVEVTTGKTVRIAVNGEFVLSSVSPVLIDPSSIGEAVGVGWGNSVLNAGSGTVTDFRYWQGMELWTGQDFDPAQF